MQVAVIGAGIAGLAAARALAPRHQVTVIEAAPRAGGHVHTVDVDGPHGPVAVDLGFIVCNRDTYPRFTALLDELGLATRATSMSFSVATPDGRSWASDRPHLRDARFLVEVVRFLRMARRDAGTTLARACTLDEYLAARRVPAEVRERLVIPLASALWSMSPARAADFPAATWLGFMEQHGMLRPIGALAWRTVVGGARRYVDALLARLPVALELGTPVRRIHRDGGAVVVDGRRFDRAVVATHADTALGLLADASDDEHRVLGAFRYAEHRVVLHGDASFLPATPASWNVAGSTITYWANRLQGLAGATYLITLDPPRQPAGVLAEVTMAHPQLDRAALAAQAELGRLGGGVIAFAGAHHGFGFHEDGLRAGEAAAARVS